MKFDSLTIGQTFKSGFYKVTKEEIITFASQYDPQYMHIDANKAEQGIFKGIIASGLLTLSLSFKLWVELEVLGDDVVAGTGINNLEFSKPVYPEDVLCVTATIIDKKERKRSGEVTILLSTKNGGDVQVLKAEMTALVSK
ncbi:MaoC/PaaZ C-terminal domain-containing protein [Lentibacillus sp. N15]|uniref:MaoC/PaaZ C-terminal domain-containing protein n=1 Tax=Lentibacillus songyuanensis TaxID=3136161 RepID=UPI0031BB96E4